MNLTRSAASLGASLGAVAALGLTAAGAASARPPALAVLTPAAVAAPSAATATNYEAGYAGSTPTSATLSAIVNVPALTCNGEPQPVLVTVGLYGADDSGNFEESGGNLTLSCQSGESATDITDDMFDPDAMPVSPGDKVQVSVSASPSGETESYTDLTTGATATDSGPGFTVHGFQTTMQGAYGTSGGGKGSGRFPAFGATKFGTVTVDGAPLASASPNKYFQQSASGKKQIAASAITNNQAFTDTFISG